MSVEALIGAALCGLSGWTLGHLAGAVVVTVRRGVRWASFSLVGRNGAAGGNGATACISTANPNIAVLCNCRETAKTPPASGLGASSDRVHTEPQSDFGVSAN